MKIYRVEHKDQGCGPYRCDYEKFSDKDRDIVTEMKIDHNDEDHPTPMKEGLWRTNCHFCAFRSIDECKKWFGKYLLPLLEMGFQIYEIEINSKYIRYGSSQLIFRHYHVKEKKVLQLDLSGLFSSTIH